MSLNAGIYSDSGRNSCGQVYSNDAASLPSGTLGEREVGLHGQVNEDIALYFADRGFALIKVVGCSIRTLPASEPRVQAG